MKKHHYFLLNVLTVTFFIYLFSFWKNSLGLFFDVPAMFFDTIRNPVDDGVKYFLFFDKSARLFSNFLVSIPFNILYLFFKNGTLLNIINSYAISYPLVHFSLLILNFLVAKRTKRYDIAIVSFAFYFIFCMPNMIWAVREVHIAVLVDFMFLSYFLAKTKLTKIDLVPISLIVLYIFESFEINCLLGIIIFVFMSLYGKKDDENICYKRLMGFGAFLSVFYIPFKILYLILFKNLVVTEGSGIYEWINASVVAFHNLYSANGIILLFSIIAIIVAIFCKKSFGWKSLFFFVPLIACCVCYLNLKTGLYPCVKLELHNYSYVFWFIFPTILAILLIDYFNLEKFLCFDIKNDSKPFFSNLFVIACIFGTMNLFWQIYSNVEFGKYVEYLKNLIKTSDEVIVKIPKNDYLEKRFLNSYNNCYGLTHRTILLSETKQINKIVFPSEFYDDYIYFCVCEKKYNYYDKGNDKISIQGASLYVKTIHWDLSPIAREYEKMGNVIN